MEPSEMTPCKYRELLEEPRVKSAITHLQCVTIECDFFSEFFSNIGSPKVYSRAKQSRIPTSKESGDVSKMFLVSIT